MSLNKVQIIGNLGNDPDIRSTQDGREIANFSIASSESWRDKQTGERKTKSDWHRVVIFSPGLVNVVKNYVKKGSKLYIEGKLQTRKWTDNSGVEKYTTEIVMNGFDAKLVMLDSKKDGGYQSEYQPPQEQVDKHNENFDKAIEEGLDDDIPF